MVPGHAGTAALAHDQRRPELVPEIRWFTGHPAASRRAAPWTAGEVPGHVGQVGQGAAAAVCDWATAHPHLEITAGTGASYPSLTVYADCGRGDIMPGSVN